MYNKTEKENRGTFRAIKLKEERWIGRHSSKHFRDLFLFRLNFAEPFAIVHKDRIHRLFFCEQFL